MRNSFACVAGAAVAMLGVGCGSSTSGGPGDVLDGKGGDISFGDTGKAEAIVLPDGKVLEGAGCKEGERVCSSEDKVVECKGGTWVVVEVCMEGYKCSEGVCSKEAECEEGERKCGDNNEVLECQLGKWVVVTVCPATHICTEGTCSELSPCTPGEVKGCYSMDSLKQCNPEGTAYIQVKCPEGQKCVAGKCGDFVCLPGQSICVDPYTKQSCLDDGSGWGEPVACPTGLKCVGGKCLSECLTDPKWANSYIGCEYWTLDLDNYHDKYSARVGTYPDEAPHGVVLTNPGNAPASVTFTSFAKDVTVNLPQVTIDPGKVAVIEMPRMDVDGSTITSRSVQINSNRPIVAYQYNPLDFQAAYSDDSSLLIPAEMLGKEYYVLSYPSGMAMPMINMPAQHGYFAVLAVEPGLTKLSVRLACKTDAPDKPGEYLAPNAYHSFELEQGEVINFQASDAELLKVNDLTGSHVIADRRVAVFGGHEEAVVEPPNAQGLGLDCCCAEHIEEQLFPLESWSDSYLCVKGAPRGGPADQDLWRIVAGKADVTLTTVPPIEGINGTNLKQKGDWVEAYTEQSFTLSANGPIMAANYLVSQGCTEQGTGDPALIMAVAPSRYRSNYVFVVPKDYQDDYIAIAKLPGEPVALDGQELAEGKFSPVGDGQYVVGYFKVKDGSHEIEGDKPFGLYQYGYSGPASYGHPGGLNLVKSQD